MEDGRAVAPTPPPSPLQYCSRWISPRRRADAVSAWTAHFLPAKMPKVAWVPVLDHEPGFQPGQLPPLPPQHPPMGFALRSHLLSRGHPGPSRGEAGTRTPESGRCWVCPPRLRCAGDNRISSNFVNAFLASRTHGAPRPPPCHGHPGPPGAGGAGCSRGRCSHQAPLGFCPSDAVVQRLHFQLI